MELWQEGYRLQMAGDLDAAVDVYRRAIELDPDFGNPYNDIGVYLMQQDRLEEAIPWLERAKRAPRYEPRQFPYMNLGRVYMRQRRWWEALHELEGAVRVAPADVAAAKALHSLRARLN
jgi:Tfp pilus assembly protein PilF